MFRNRSDNKHWDYETQFNSTRVTLKTIAEALVFRPGTVMLSMTVSAALLVSYRFRRITGCIVIILVTLCLLSFFRLAGGSFRSRVACFYLLLCPLTMFFYLRSESHDRFSREYSERINGKIIQLEGTIVSVPDLSADSEEWGSVKIRLCNGCAIQLSGNMSELEYGDSIIAKAKITKPEPATNPGGFSMSSYLSSQGIYSTAELILRQEMEVVDEANYIRKLYSSVRARSAIRSVVNSTIESQQANLLLAVFLGEDKLLDPITKINFRRSGLAHLTSVSGSHVSFILIPISIIAAFLRLKRKSAAALEIILLIVYGTLTGWNTGTIRAVIMITILIILRANDRYFDAFNALGIACSCMILLDVYIVLQIGFWLSAGAASILVILATPLAEWSKTTVLKKTGFMLPDVLIHSLSAVLLLQLFMILVSAKLTGEIFWLSWLFNFPAIFIVSIVCTLSVFMLPGLLIFDYLSEYGIFEVAADLFKTASELILDSPLRLLRWLAETGSVNTARIPTNDLNILIYAGCAYMFICLWFRYIKPRHFNYGRLPIWGGSILLIAGLTLAFIRFLTLPVWSLYFLDVGQGDCLIMVNRHKDLTVLVDGGPKNSGYFDIEPAMAVLGIRSIDLAIATHGHADHTSGVIEMIRLGLVEEVAVPYAYATESLQKSSSHKQKNSYESDVWEEKDLTNTLLDICKHSSIPVQYLKKHDTITLPNNTSMTIMAPDNEMDISSIIKDPNEASLIMSFDWDQIRLLLLADLTEKQENLLMPYWPEADLIKTAHHGSKVTTGELFLNKVKPKHAVISSGPNIYGHPSPAVLERLVASGCRIWRTDSGGCVIVEMKNSEARINYYDR